MRQAPQSSRPALASVIGGPHSLRALALSPHPPGTRRTIQARVVKFGLVGCPKYPDSPGPCLDYPRSSAQDPPIRRVFVAPRVTASGAFIPSFPAETSLQAPVCRGNGECRQDLLPHRFLAGCKEGSPNTRSERLPRGSAGSKGSSGHSSATFPLDTGTITRDPASALGNARSLPRHPQGAQPRWESSLSDSEQSRSRTVHR